MLDILTGVAGALGGLFGKKNKQSESFESTTNSEAEASSQDLSPELLKTLEALFQSTVGGGGFQKSGQAMSSRLDQILAQAQAPQFDVSGFSKGIVDQAVAGAGLDLESGINDILMGSGMSEGGSSMSALLANKLRNQTAANLGGIASEATATGEGIRLAQQGQITEGIAGLSGGLSDQILQLIQSTRGASNTGKSKSKEHTKGKGTMQGSSRGNPFSAFADIFGSFNNAKGNA